MARAGSKEVKGYLCSLWEEFENVRHRPTIDIERVGPDVQLKTGRVLNEPMATTTRCLKRFDLNRFNFFSEIDLPYVCCHFSFECNVSIDPCVGYTLLSNTWTYPKIKTIKYKCIFSVKIVIKMIIRKTLKEVTFLVKRKNNFFLFLYKFIGLPNYRLPVWI